MPSLSRRWVAALVLGALVVGIALPALAARASASFVVVREGDIVGEDFYVAANRVSIEGTVQGDLMVAAADEVSITGLVEGDVVVGTQTVTISGEIKGSLRGAAGEVIVTGSIGDDLMMAAGTVEVTDRATIGRDALVWSWDAQLLGEVGRNVEGQMRTLALGGEVTGNVEVAVSRLEIPARLVVGGDLGYRSRSEATTLDNAEVRGVVLQKRPLPPNLRIRGLRVLAIMLTAFAVAGIGLAVTHFFTGRVARAAAAVRSRPGRSLLAGMAVLVTPILLLLLGVLSLSLFPPAAGVPLLAVVVPIVIVISSAVALLTLIAPIPALVDIGGRLRAGLGTSGAFLLGWLVAAVVALLPWVGGVALLVIIALGWGGWLRSMRAAAAVEQ